MNNEQMMTRFFSGKVGEEMLRSASDENLTLRGQLVSEIESKISGFNETVRKSQVFKLSEKKDKAFLAFKKAESEWQNEIVADQRAERIYRNELQNLKNELIAASPDYIHTCRNKLLEMRATLGSLESNQGVVFHKIMERVESWLHQDLTFDEMKKEFEGMVKEVETIPSLKKRIFLGTVEPPKSYGRGFATA